MRPRKAGDEVPAELRARVEPALRALVADRLGVDAGELLPDASLHDDLAVDSLDLLDLALVLESRLGVRLKKRRMNAVRTYRELVEMTVASLDASAVARPLVVRSRLVPARSGGGDLHRAGLLTPYEMELMAEDAAGAGRGSSLELAVPPGTDDAEIDSLEARLAWLARLGVEVHVSRARIDIAMAPNP